MLQSYHKLFSEFNCYLKLFSVFNCRPEWNLKVDTSPSEIWTGSFHSSHFFVLLRVSKKENWNEFRKMESICMYMYIRLYSMFLILSLLGDLWHKMIIRTRFWIISKSDQILCKKALCRAKPRKTLSNFKGKNFGVEMSDVNQTSVKVLSANCVLSCTAWAPPDQILQPKTSPNAIFSRLPWLPDCVEDNVKTLVFLKMHM